MTLALSTAVVGVAYTAYTYNRRASDVSAATSSVRDLNQRVLASYASAASFTGLTKAAAIQDGVYPAGLMQTGQPQSVWNGAIELSAINLNGGNDNGFALTYEGVDPNTCPSFVVNAGPGFYDVKVNGSSAMSGRKVLPTVASALCSQVSGPSVVQFIQAKSSPLGVQNPTLDPPCTVAPPETQAVACPAGQISSVSPFSVNGITQTRESFCAGAYGAAGWSPWTTVGNTCTPSCATQLSGLTPNPASQTQTVPRSATCPAGETGTHTWSQLQVQTRVATCAGPTPISAPTWGAWSAWADTGPRLGEVNTCSPTCATRLAAAPWLPNPATATQTVSRSAACPSGQAGTHTWQQKQTQTRTATCTTPAAAVNPAWGGWSAWADTGARLSEVNTCAPLCVAPAPTVTNPTQWVNRSASCPSGYTGSHTWQAEQSRTATTTYSCPALTGSYTVHPTTYSGWTDTGAKRSESNTCKDAGTWAWERDPDGTSYYYEPSARGEAPQVDYSGSYKAPTYPGCYTCYPKSNSDYSCSMNTMMLACKCDANNAGATFSSRWSDAGNGYGEAAVVCVKK